MAAWSSAFAHYRKLWFRTAVRTRLLQFANACRNPRANGRLEQCQFSRLSRRACRPSVLDIIAQGHGPARVPSRASPPPGISAVRHSIHLPRKKRSTVIRFSVSVPGFVGADKSHRAESFHGRQVAYQSPVNRLRVRAPKAREIVTTAGSASGIAATARLTAVRNINITGWP